MGKQTAETSPSVRQNKEFPVSPWPEWRIIEKVGEGSFGCVYKAERSERGQTFYSAVKLITIPGSSEEWDSVLKEAGTEEGAKAYFENLLEDCIQEVGTMEYFHGNSYIVSVEDFKVLEYEDCVSWELFIRMEFLESFAEYCAGRDFQEDEIIRLGIDLSQALCCLKKCSIVHRDIKPENIFVSRFGNFKLGDFGIARRMEKSLGALSKKGTDSYMAPEMYHGETYDGRADICSLGLVLYRLANRNRLPFVSLDKQLITYRDKENALEKRMAGEELPPPAEADAALAGIILKACAYDPEERYGEPEELLQDLQKLEKERKAALERPDGTDISGHGGHGPRRSVLRGRKERVRKTGSGERDTGSGEEHGTARKRNYVRFIIPGILVIALVVILSILGSTLLMRQMLEDVVKQQSQQMMNSIQESGTAADQSSTLDFDQSIRLINERATTIVENQKSYSTRGKEGDRLIYYDQDGELRKVLLYPSRSEDGRYEEYYYWNDMLFFAYVWDEDTNDIYYYRDGILIRWIDSDGLSHDNEQDNPDYVERGDKYWVKSLEVRYE